MRARVADLLSIGIDQVSIKAKTPEGLNLDHVAQCHAVALVERVHEPDELKSMSAVIETQRQLEDVVEDLLSSVHGVPKKRTSPPSTTRRTLPSKSSPSGACNTVVGIGQVGDASRKSPLECFSSFCTAAA